jgi:PKD repeat protein
VPGDYTVRLTVEDDGGATGTTTINVTAWTPNPSPNASPVADFSYTCDGLACTFDGGDSYDPDGSLASFSWDFGDGNQGGSASTSHSYGSAGSYVVTLTVTDNAGATDSVETTVSVSGGGADPNEPPVANFSRTCDLLSCSFNGTASYDSDGQVVEYRWSFGDGTSNVLGSRPTHTFPSGGTYLVTLRVTDDDGAATSKSTYVTVQGPPAELQIELSVSGEKFRGNKSATLNWSGATGSTVSIYRDNSILVSTSNDGQYVDATVENRAKSAVYKVCESGGSPCSDPVTVTF